MQWHVVAYDGRGQFKSDVTRAETKFHLSCENGRVHLNRPVGGASVQSTTNSRGVGISGSNAGYTVFRGSVKGTGYPLHSPVSFFTSCPVRHRVPSHFKRSLTPEDPCLLFWEFTFLPWWDQSSSLKGTIVGRISPLCVPRKFHLKKLTFVGGGNVYLANILYGDIPLYCGFVRRL